MEVYGPWVTWGKRERPEGLEDRQRIQVVYVNAFGDVIVDNGGRSVGSHCWVGKDMPKAITLAYRVKRNVRVLYGSIGSAFEHNQTGATHKMTYTVDGDDIVEFKMEKL